MITQESINTYRKTSIVVGIVYLAGFVVGLTGSGLIQSVLSAPNPLSTVSANSIIIAIGVIFWLLAVAGDAAHGILLYPILKQHSERVAVGYLASRIIDAVFIAVSVLFVLLQIPLGGEYLKATAPTTASLQILSTLSVQANLSAYAIGMMALGLAGLILNYTFYRAKLLPRWIALWGLAGYAIIFCGMASEILGSGLGLVSSLPGGLWEIFVGGWLIVKGFNPSAFLPQAPKTSQQADTVVANS